MSGLELEIEVKTAKPFRQEDLEDAKVNSLIGKTDLGVFTLDNEERFEYKRITIRLDQVESRGDFDGVHTVLYLPYGTFLANINYDKFNVIYHSMTGISLPKKISDFSFARKRKEE